MNKLTQAINKALAEEQKHFIPSDPGKVHIFLMTPIPKPRMTQRDKWKNTRSKQAQRYMDWSAELQALNTMLKFRPDGAMRIKFYLPMPEKWDLDQRAAMNNQKHQLKPDRDNLEKAFLDALMKEDCVSWHGDVYKYWTANHVGRIEVENI